MKRFGWFCILMVSVFVIWRLFVVDAVIENQPTSPSVWANIISLVLATLVFICILVVSFFRTFVEKDQPTIEKSNEEKK